MLIVSLTRHPISTQRKSVSRIGHFEPSVFEITHVGIPVWCPQIGLTTITKGYLLLPHSELSLMKSCKLFI